MKKHLLILTDDPQQNERYILMLHKNKTTFAQAFENVLSHAKEEGFTGYIHQIPLEWWTKEDLCPIPLELTKYANEYLQPNQKRRTAMTKERMFELLNQIVDWVGIAENTNGQIQQLLNMGFTPEELTQEFHFSKQDMQDYLETQDA